MSNPLRPEVRVNKNGVPVIKHVRSGEPVSSDRTTSIPAPSAAPAKVRPKPSTAPKLWDYNKSSIRADWDIVQSVRDTFKARMNYTCQVSDAEAYDVMAVVAPRNLLPLLASGIRTRDQATKFLRSEGLEDYLIDNTALVEEAISRRVAARKIMLMDNDFPYIGMEHKFYFDAAEVNSIKALQELESGRGVTERVLNGTISASDIKKIGAVRIASAGGNSQVLEQLAMINAGNSSISVEQLAKIITKANPRTIQSDPYTVNQTVRAARLYGPEVIIALDNLDLLNRKAREISAIVDDPKEAGEMLVWADRIWQLSKSVPETADIVMLYRADISAEVAAEHFESGMTAQQIIALTQENIEPSLTSGWL